MELHIALLFFGLAVTVGQSVPGINCQYCSFSDGFSHVQDDHGDVSCSGEQCRWDKKSARTGCFVDTSELKFVALLGSGVCSRSLSLFLFSCSLFVFLAFSLFLIIYLFFFFSFLCFPFSFLFSLFSFLSSPFSFLVSLFSFLFYLFTVLFSLFFFLISLFSFVFLSFSLSLFLSFIFLSFSLSLVALDSEVDD